ncbi:hypothetical protein LCGC14_1986150 [marine sediment metagenome]|uniref:Uncharacterized protein n=1 Tax=marine sediment metagenome TaxID=412755 RepID=A0A0F9F7E9_9ZZZZ
MKLQFIIDIATVPPGSLSVKKRAGIQCKSCLRLHMRKISHGSSTKSVPHCESIYGSEDWSYAKLVYPFCRTQVKDCSYIPWRKL